MKLKISFYFLICILFLTFALQNANAKNYNVHNAVEIKNAMQTAQPGDTLIMASGLWTDQHIVFQGNGETGHPIVLRAETPGMVILNGTSTLRIAGDYLTVDGLRFIGGYSRSGAVIEFRNGSLHSNHSRLTNSSIVEYNPQSKGTDYKWVSLYGSYNRVDHCFFKGKTHSGTTLVVWLSAQPNYHLIDHNYFAHRPSLGQNGGETIRVGTSDWSMYDSFTTVEQNYFEECNGETEIISNKSCENVYRNNTFFNCEGVLTLRHGNRCTVQGNFFLGNKNYSAGGVRIIGEDHKVFNNYFYQLNGTGYRSALCMVLGVPHSPANRYFQVKRALVAFNTFVSCRKTMLIGYGSSDDQSLPPLDCTISNNIAVSDNDIIEYATDPVNMKYEGNIMFGDLGIPQQDGITLIDPQLALDAEGLWRLTESSPAIGAAVGNYPFLMDDMDGQPRGENKDVGADQYSDAPVLYRPLTASDVGPDWLGTSIPPALLTIHTSGSGKVVLDPPGGIYDAMQIVTLLAVPDSGWRFEGWSGDVPDNSNPIQITMDVSKTITAKFVRDLPQQYHLSVYVFTSGGHVITNPQGESFAAGTHIVVTAVPDSGWRFTGWGGSLSGSANPDTVIMDEDKSIFANFESIPSLVTGHIKPNTFYLGLNYPNPFNPVTHIPYEIAKASHVKLLILNSLGQEVIVLVNEYQQPGKYNVTWNGMNKRGTTAQSGLYVYRLEADSFQKSGKMILLK